MQALPERFATDAELDEFLARPSEALIEAFGRLDGDIMVLGSGGKVGPSLTRMAKRAADASGTKRRVMAVDVVPQPLLENEGIETLQCDLLDMEAVQRLPQVENVVYMVGRKFGSTGQESLTWAINVIVPYHVARTFRKSRIASFSTGCVYPVMHIKTGGATERTPVNPVGEYAMSCLGRERMFDYFADIHGGRVVTLRLNYAVELRYGVLFDVATRVASGEPINVKTGYANVMWQGDVCDQILRSLELASAPARVLNITGPELFSIREAANAFGRLLGKEATFEGEENGLGYLNNAQQANALFGNPRVPLGKIIEWTADWVGRGGSNLAKPTHFETQDGKY